MRLKRIKICFRSLTFLASVFVIKFKLEKNISLSFFIFEFIFELNENLKEIISYGYKIFNKKFN